MNDTILQLGDLIYTRGTDGRWWRTEGETEIPLVEPVTKYFANPGCTTDRNGQRWKVVGYFSLEASSPSDYNSRPSIKPRGANDKSHLYIVPKP